MGSAGAKATAVVLGDGDVYAHGGGQYEWDSAAPVGVAAAAGCHTSRLDGSPLRYNQPDPYLPDLLVCRPELADRCSPPSPAPPFEAAVALHGPPARKQKSHVRRPATVSRLHTGCGAAWLARSVRDAEAPGSNPGTPTLVSAGQRPEGATTESDVCHPAHVGLVHGR